jgi:hypothetical protein
VDYFKTLSPFAILLFVVIVLLLVFTDIAFISASFDYSTIWKLVDWLFFSGILGLFLPSIKKSLHTEVISATKFSGRFLETTNFLFYLLLFYFGYFVAISLLKWFVSAKYLLLFDKAIQLVFYVSISFALVISQLFWLSNLKTKGAKKLILSFISLLGAFAFVMTINFFFSDEMKLEENARVIDTFFSIAGIVIVFFAFKMKNWIAISSRYVIKRLILYSTLMIVLFIILLSQGFHFQKGLYFSNFFFFHLTQIMSAIFLVNYIRVFYLSIISLPLSKIVEQKVYEVNSLSYLTKIVRNFNKIEDICNVITELSYNSMKRSPAILVFLDGNSFEIKSHYGLNSNFDLENVHNFFRNIKLSEINTSKIIYSLEEFELNEDFEKPNDLLFKSLCIVPIFVREKLFGHLIVANPTEHFFDEDDLNLLSSFVETLSIAVENYFLIKDTIEKEKYRKELLIARDIQLSFLPKELPKTDRIEISSFIHPSEEVGGDFYDFIELSEDKLFVIIGDVSGKGLGAAFYMALLKGIFFTLSKNIKTAKDFLIQLNSSLFRKIDRQIHITITALLFDFKNEQVEVVRAGHLPTFVKSGNDTLVVKTNGIGISLAKTSYFAKKLESLSLNISDAEYFVLFTDGLVEIIGDKDINKGIEKLKQIVENEVFSNPKELVEKVIENVRRNGTNFDDDATLLVLKVKNVSSTKIERYDREVINQ